MNETTNAYKEGIGESNDERFTIVGFLRSDKWAFISFLFIVTPLMVHTSGLIIKVSGLSFGLFPHDELIYSFLFALGFDTAILTFALSGKEKEAKGLAVIVFLLNFGFMNYGFVEELANGSITFNGFHVFQTFIRLIISGAGAYIVHSYVIFFLDRIKEDSFLKKVFSQKKELEEKTKELEKEISEQQNTIKELESFKDKLYQDLPDLDELQSDVSAKMKELHSKAKAFESKRSFQEEAQSVVSSDGNITKVSTKKKTLKKKVAEVGDFKCECGRSFTSQKALSGHLTHCSFNK